MAKLIGLALAAFMFTFLIVHWQGSRTRDSNQKQVFKWLLENHFIKYRTAIYNAGCTNLVECAAANFLDGDGVHDLPAGSVEAYAAAAALLRQQLILQHWLESHALKHLLPALRKCNVHSLKEVQSFFTLGDKCIEHQVKSLDDLLQLHNGIATLPGSSIQLEHLSTTIWNHIYTTKDPLQWSFGGMVVFSLIVATLVAVASMTQPAISRYRSAATKHTFLEYVTGKYLTPQNCKVHFDWDDPTMVGKTMSFCIKFYQRNGRDYPVCDRDNILVEITQGGIHKIAASVEIGGTESHLINTARIHFTVRRAGFYKISILVDMQHIKGSPFSKQFISDVPDPNKTVFINHSSSVVSTENVPYELVLEPRDRFGNVCTGLSEKDLASGYTLTIHSVPSNEAIDVDSVISYNASLKQVVISTVLAQQGCYKAKVTYQGQVLRGGDFNIIVLNAEDSATVQKNISQKSHNIYYEARIAAINGEHLPKPKRVFCYISPKQLTIKEYILKIIPMRFATFRLCPSTKFIFNESCNESDLPTLVIDDGCQAKIKMTSSERNIIAATFSQFLLKNIGGSETFKDKQDFFYHEVRKLHQKRHHEKIQIKVQRDKLLECAMKSTKGYTTADWCRNFEISFQGEEGLDWGGLRREWITLICSALFDDKNSLFCRFKDDKQGLVHPNSKRPPHMKLKYYEFAGKIVGKCLYESSLGGTYRQLVKARFTRSFLAQIIGLRVHYKHFEQDDPDLFVSKIKFILENDVQEVMDLFFVEEEYNSSGKIVKVAELIPGGTKIKVTNDNKLQYLDALAQYKLANSIKDEVEAFLKGLNDLIPDNLLSIFDENELELLMCGTGQFSIADFKANHVACGSGPSFKRVLDWFWTTVTNFTDEEFAKLLQFTTGCSQLPTGGFAELTPKFQIMEALTFGNLPTAHTCFNQLRLPDYESYENLEKSLRLAISEGSEGFGMI